MPDEVIASPTTPVPINLPMPTPDQALEILRNQAEVNVDWFLATTNAASQASMYAMKTMMAHDVVGGGAPSTLLVNEAELRGVDVGTLAANIVAKSKSDEDRELRRVKTKLALREAKSKSEIATVMIENGFSLMNLSL